MKNVELIQRDVVDELASDPKVDSSHIAVTVTQDIVVLSGWVTSYPEKRAAEAGAKRVKGVDAVVDKLEVRFISQAPIGDEAIADAAVHALRWNLRVPETSVKVIVNEGWVTLEGEVDWHYQREAAEFVVRDFAGVKGVTNDIIVIQPVDAAKVQENIEAAFKRSAAVDADHVRVDIEDGTVTLTGTVGSWLAHEEATRAAGAAPGVRKVVNELKIEVPVMAV